MLMMKLKQIGNIINTMFRLISGSKCVINVVPVKIIIHVQNMCGSRVAKKGI